MVAAPPTNAGGGESSKSPQAILSDMQRDLRKVKSYHFAGSITGPGGVTKVSADVSGAGSASFGIIQGKTSLRMILLSKSTYLKANAVYWRASDKERGALFASKLADRWVKVPESVRGPFKPWLAEFSPEHLAACVFVGTGTLSNNGVTTFGGRKVIAWRARRTSLAPRPAWCTSPQMAQSCPCARSTGPAGGRQARQAL